MSSAGQPLPLGARKPGERAGKEVLKPPTTPRKAIRTPNSEKRLKKLRLTTVQRAKLKNL